MKLFFLGLCAVLVSGCAPSLCLFNCGSTTNEPIGGKTGTSSWTIVSGDGARCVIKNEEMEQVNSFRMKQAICYEVKEQQ